MLRGDPVADSVDCVGWKATSLVNTLREGTLCVVHNGPQHVEDCLTDIGNVPETVLTLLLRYVTCLEGTPPPAGINRCDYWLDVLADYIQYGVPDELECRVQNPNPLWGCYSY